jgi:hypothetical protein
MMNLSTALQSARQGIEQNAVDLGTGRKGFLPFWLSELNIQALASQLAMEKILVPHLSSSRDLLFGLLKGLEVELNHIARSTNKASKIFYTGGNSLLEAKLHEIDVHVRRHQVKSCYIEGHLATLLSQSELESLGQHFHDERERLCRSMKLMDEGR